MPSPRRNHRHPTRSSQSERSRQPDQNDIMASMMSPATKLLLANMNRSRVNNNISNIDKGGHLSTTSSNANGDSNEHHGKNRRPLKSIQEASAANNNSNNNGHSNILKGSESMTSSKITAPNQKNKQRVIGPHETNYTQNYKSYITQTINNYESKLQSNIGKKSILLTSLPSYKCMNGQERMNALVAVDDLLERLSVEEDVGVNDKGEAVLDAQQSRSRQNDSGGNNSGSSGAETDNHHDQSFGSATTMGGHDNTTNDTTHQNTTVNKSTSSETTMMEQSISLLNNSTTRNSIMDASTTMEQSMSLLGDDTDRSKCSNHGRKSLESDANTTAHEQSMSLLGNESHLFSPCNVGGGMEGEEDDDDDESRFSKGGNMKASATAAPIENVRRYQPNDSNNDDDRMMMMASPQFTSTMYNHKRCASNSGKRGLKSRLRYQDDDNDGGGGRDFTADDSLLQHFDSNSNNDNNIGVGGMFFPSQEDEFSPIQHRFSHDGLEFDCGIDGYGDGGGDDDDDASRGSNYGDRFRHGDSGKLFSTRQDGGGGGEDDDVSFDCNDGGFDNYDDDDGGCGANTWTQTSRPLTQQQSQWSTFKTVDPATQTNEEDSPVKRRAIRFESTQKGYSRHPRNQREQEVVREDEHEKIQSMRDELVDMAVRDHPVAAAADQGGDDPIQTVGNLCRRARSCNEAGIDTSLLDEVAPIDVRLRDGRLFQKDPLQCHQVQKKKSSSKGNSKGGRKTVRIAKGSWNDRHAASDSEESLSDQDDPSYFKDPTSSFPSRVADRLNGAFEFMMKNEGESTTSAAAAHIYPDSCVDQNAGLLLSLDLKQTKVVTSKLLLTTMKLARSHQNSKNRKIASTSTPSTANAAPPRSADYLAGGTLIILRAKEDIPTWEAALREYTSLSVISHNSLHARERKSASAAAKFAVHDVVLTTYDLLKSKDATIPVDSIGKAILNSDSKKNTDEGGWLKTRGSETQSGGEAKQTCLHLTILHRLSWYRVIMMDCLGKRGYLTKPDTARAVAARAVNSLSRFIFFVKEEDDVKMENKFKNDRKQMKAVVNALHLPSGTTGKTFLGRWAYDVKSNVKESSLDSSSSDERSTSDGYGCDGNESSAEPW